nr:metallophosphoesterase [uncultured Rhizobium sp.]
MKAWLFSDLHLECDPLFGGLHPPEADLCICAGDIADSGIVPSVRWLAQHVLPSMPVILVCGNHEYYGSVVSEAHTAARAAIQNYRDFYLLNGEAVELNGFRFFGATLWTDFEILGDPKIAKFDASRQLNDYRQIKLSKRPFKRFSTSDSQYLHRKALGDLDEFFRLPSDKPTIVVSHHAPSLMSVPQKFLRDPLTPAFASNLEGRILEFAPSLWVHGHIHWPSDYVIGATRVICNPRGYPTEPSHFVPNLVIDLAKYAC